MRKGEHLSNQLASLIQRVNDHYQSVRLMRCWIRLGITSVALVVLFTLMLVFLPSLGVPKQALIAGFALSEILAFWFLLVRPLRKPVTNQNIALYIEEHHPDLQNRILSAYDFSSKPKEYNNTWMLEKFFEETGTVNTRMSIMNLVDTDLLVKLLLTAACFLFFALVILVGTYRHWIPEFTISQQQNTATAVIIDYELSVEPGDVRVRKGESQVIFAKTTLEADSAALRWRTAGSDWNSELMERGIGEQVFHYKIPAVLEDIEYQVVVADQQSDLYTIHAWIPPEVQSLDLTYRYPDYLEMETKKVPNGTTISGMEGTVVEIDAWVNTDLASAVMQLDKGGEIAFTKAEQYRWRAEIELTESDQYQINLADLNGETNEYAPKYAISVKTDEKPQVKIGFPKGDLEVTMLDEIPFEFTVSDDYGLKDYGIQYEIAGQEIKRLSMKKEGDDPLQVSVAHIVPLETLKVFPGDFITWSVWAEDRKPDRSEFDTLGDPFFIEIRPFRQMFSEAMTNAGGQQQQQQQQGEQQGQNAAADQKQVIIATWNLRRIANTLDQEEFDQKLSTIVEAQKGILESVASGEQNLTGSPQDMERLNEALNDAVVTLESTTLEEAEKTLSTALSSEQTAHHLMLKMQPDETEVQQQLAQAGQQGQSGGQSNSDRQQVDELELDRNRNFYEEESRLQEQQMQETNEALESIQELTQRQQSIEEEIARLISEMQKEEDPEELRRRLERLQEEERRNLERLDEVERNLAMGNLDAADRRDTQQALNEAREQMNRSLESMEQENLQQARNASSRARSSLNEMERQLEQYSGGAARQKMEELQEQMDNLVRDEQSVISQINEFQENLEKPGLNLDDNEEEKKQELLQKKAEISQNFEELMKDAADLAERSKQSQELMSQKLGDWLRETSQKGIQEDIEQESKLPLIRYSVWDRAVEQEEKILTKLNESAEDLKKLSDYLIEDELEGMQRALDEIAQLMETNGQNPNGEQNNAQNQQGQQQNGQPGEQQEGQQEGNGQQGNPQDGQQPGGQQQNAEQQNDEQAGGQQGSQQNGQQPGEQQGEQQQGNGQEGSQQPDEQQQGQQPGSQQGGQQQGNQQQNGQQSGQQQGGQQQGGQQQGGQQQGSQQNGQQPGQQQGDQQQGSQQQNGQQQGNQQGGQQQGGQQQGNQQGNQQRDGQQPGQQQGSRNAQQGGNRNTYGGGGGPEDFGRWSDLNLPRTPDEMREFVEADYREWVERLRNAENLLPQDSVERGELTRVREEVEDLRRGYRDESLSPRFDLFLEKVTKPLAKAASEIDKEIRRRLGEEEYVLADEGEIPPVYQKRVAEYFKALSETEREPAAQTN